MSKIIDLINLIPNISALPKASEKDINEAMLELGVQFADEYVEYLKSFGALITDGFQITGITKDSCHNVVNITRQEWELNPKAPRNLYVIQKNIGPFTAWQDEDGYVYLSSANNEPMKVWSTLYDYIEPETRTPEERKQRHDAYLERVKKELAEWKKMADNFSDIKKNVLNQLDDLRKNLESKMADDLETRNTENTDESSGDSNK